MTPAELARLHAAAFQRERPWSVQEFADLLQSEHVELLTEPQGFALYRTIADESELLTLAVHPDNQRQGIGKLLMIAWLEDCQGRADTAFLEVAADDFGAVKLYTSLGFATFATRPRYYARKDADPADALLMRRNVTLGQPKDSGPTYPESG